MIVRPLTRNAGFTLLEVLIALIIALIAGASLLQAVGSGLRATTAAVRYNEAVVRAESHLDAAQAGPLRPGTWDGDEGNGYHWRLRITRIQTPTAPGGTGTAVALYSLATQISWRDGIRTRSVTLATEQVGAK